MKIAKTLFVPWPTWQGDNLEMKSTIGEFLYKRAYERTVCRELNKMYRKSNEKLAVQNVCGKPVNEQLILILLLQIK